MKTKCIICKDINRMDTFILCCGENMCHTCMSETEGKPCPTCGVINNTLSLEGEDMLRGFSKLAAQGHQGAIDKLPSLLNIIASVSNNPKLKKEAIRCAKRSKHGSIGNDLGLTRDELVEIQREAMKMNSEGRGNGEIHKYIQSMSGLRPTNVKTLDQMEADPMRSCSHCGISDPEYTCGRCESVMFCNRGCQKAGWKMHKKKCNKKLTA